MSTRRPGPETRPQVPLVCACLFPPLFPLTSGDHLSNSFADADSALQYDTSKVQARTARRTCRCAARAGLRLEAVAGSGLDLGWRDQNHRGRPSSLGFVLILYCLAIVSDSVPCSNEIQCYNVYTRNSRELTIILPWFLPRLPD